jgi:plastocyanin
MYADASTHNTGDHSCTGFSHGNTDRPSDNGISNGDSHGGSLRNYNGGNHKTKYDTLTKITTIHIRNNTFVPDQLTVLPGTGITWINDDPVTHVVKGIGNSTGKFTSAEMVRDAHFGYTFGEATGTFEFGDPAYPAMKGAIIVKQGDSIVGGSPLISSSTP